MSELMTRTVTRVWIVLMVLTCVKTWGMPSMDFVAVEVATVIVLALAGVKIWLVMDHFMEVGRAPLGWKAFFAGWTALATAMVAGMYLLA